MFLLDGYKRQFWDEEVTIKIQFTISRIYIHVHVFFLDMSFNVESRNQNYSRSKVFL
jgi:hypothetical protein